VTIVPGCKFSVAPCAKHADVTMSGSALKQPMSRAKDVGQDIDVLYPFLDASDRLDHPSGALARQYDAHLVGLALSRAISAGEIS